MVFASWIIPMEHAPALNLTKPGSTGAQACIPANRAGGKGMQVATLNRFKNMAHYQSGIVLRNKAHQKNQEQTQTPGCKIKNGLLRAEINARRMRDRPGWRFSINLPPGAAKANSTSQLCNIKIKSGHHGLEYV